MLYLKQTIYLLKKEKKQQKKKRFSNMSIVSDYFISFYDSYNLTNLNFSTKTGFYIFPKLVFVIGARELKIYMFILSRLMCLSFKNWSPHFDLRYA